MGDEMELDAEKVASLEEIYCTTPIVQRRRRVRDAIGLRPGEEVLSIGTGPGFESQGLAEDVGETGRVHGIDTAEAMLTVARDRCDDQSWVTFEQGDAADMPVPDATFDAAVAVQVYEYVADLDAAFEELHRVLRPGGRAVVLDTDWSTLTFQAGEQDRSSRIIEGFESHCPHPLLGRTLAARLEGANLTVTDQDAFVLFETAFDEDAFSRALIPAIKESVTLTGGINESEFDAWVDHLQELDDAGEYLFSLNQYLSVAEKPDGPP